MKILNKTHTKWDRFKSWITKKPLVTDEYEYLISCDPLYQMHIKTKKPLTVSEIHQIDKSPVQYAKDNFFSGTILVSSCKRKSGIEYNETETIFVDGYITTFTIKKPYYNYTSTYICDKGVLTDCGPAKIICYDSDNLVLYQYVTNRPKVYNIKVHGIFIINRHFLTEDEVLGGHNVPDVLTFSIGANLPPSFHESQVVIGGKVLYHGIDFISADDLNILRFEQKLQRGW